MGEQSAKTIERTMLGGALEDAGETPMRLLGDETSGSLRVALFVWDSSNLIWVKQPYFDFSGLQTAIENLQTSIDALTTAIEAM